MTNLWYIKITLYLAHTVCNFHTFSSTIHEEMLNMCINQFLSVSFWNSHGVLERLCNNWKNIFSICSTVNISIARFHYNYLTNGVSLVGNGLESSAHRLLPLKDTVLVSNNSFPQDVFCLPCRLSASTYHFSIPTNYFFLCFKFKQKAIILRVLHIF